MFRFGVATLLAALHCVSSSLAAPATAPASAPTTLATGRLEVQLDGLTVEYSHADEAFAREMGTWLTEVRRSYLKRLDGGGSAYLALTKLSREADLRFIAEQLALDAPTPEMQKLYGFFATNVVSLVKSHLRFDRATVWRASDLTRRLEGGERIPSFSLNEKGKPTYNWNFSFETKLGAPRPASQPSNPLVVPILLRDDDPNHDPASLEREKKDVLRMLDSLADPKFTYGRITEQLAVLALHEVTEGALLGNYLRSADRRWFLDGVANYLAYERARQKFGAQTVEALYRGAYRPEKYAPWLDKVDLEHWPVAEAKEAALLTGDLLHAHYYLATETIRTVADYHGPDLLPKLLKELKSVAPERATIADVYATYTKLTGDDLRQVIDRTRRRLLREADAGTTRPASAPAAE